MSKLNDLQVRRQAIEQGGGAKEVKKQHDDNKKTARERIAMLFDEGSFVEIDAFVTHRSREFNMAQTEAPAEGVVCGYGTVDGRLVYAYSQDFTVIGGALGEMHAEKICKVMDMAVKMGAPIVAVCDSAGARLQEGLDALKGFGDIFRRSALLSGVVPYISVVAGPCAGGASFVPAMSDFVFMIDKTSQMFITGPSIIKGSTNDDITAETLGGAQVHAEKSGMSAVTCGDEEECFAQVRALLSYLPSNNLEMAAEPSCTDDLNRLSEKLTGIVPEDSKTAYDVKEIIAEVVDGGVFYEMFKYYAQNIVTGFAKMNGMTVGIVANQANVKDGVLDSNASDKGARFVRFCDCYNIPIITFTDAPGYAPCLKAENNGLIRHAAKLVYAFAEATVPKINIIVRKAYGTAYIAMNSKHLGADMVFAWPTAEIAVMAPDGAANIIFKDDIAEAKNPAKTREDKISEYAEKFCNPYVAASRGYVDDVIEADSTRPRVISALEMLMSKRETRPSKKHGNIPV